ncbi:hypothetical protein MOC47_04455 [Bacillus spizizenii]|nr:hypothetical protein [Bacillus spizizenii]MCY8043033.1 hypothetical protein [Bacillus spizizenii]MCY8166221.1 hypothetical protein [Bacillus spizizenii]MCY8253994.1 hypothetical protein [Bacillus spizizenii]MCY8328093.1 hypothetical protein [Bacillus spizizenii]
MAKGGKQFMPVCRGLCFSPSDTADLQMLMPLYREGIIGLQKLISE